MKFLIFAALVLTSLHAPAKLLVISDVDDTLKESYILNRVQMVRRALRTDLAFPGMANVLQELVAEQKFAGQDVRIYYVSSAPAILMRKSHSKFLESNQFPPGVLELRSLRNPFNYKVETIQKILAAEKPQSVILIGDHGEKDPDVYRQISEQLTAQKIPHAVFIRQLYPMDARLIPEAEADLGPSMPQPGQQVFVSAAELAIGFYDLGLLTASGMRLRLGRFATPGAEYVYCKGHRLAPGRRSSIEIPDVVLFVRTTTLASCR